MPNFPKKPGAKDKTMWLPGLRRGKGVTWVFGGGGEVINLYPECGDRYTNPCMG